MSRSKAYSEDDVKRTIKKHEKRLLNYPNVLYLAIGEKICGDSGQRQLAIRVCVSEKQKIVDKKSIIPVRLRAVKPDGKLADYYIPTDVEKTQDNLKTLGLRGGDTVERSTLGSVGFVFQGSDENDYILTNAHVVLAIDEVANNQTFFDIARQQIGTVFKATPLVSTPGHIHVCDAAAGIPTVTADRFRIDGNPTAIVAYGIRANFTHGISQQFFYQRKNGERLIFSRPNWVTTPRFVDVDGVRLLFTNFVELTLLGGALPQQGDSGSALLTDTGNGLMIHGILFAGGGDKIAVIEINDIFEALA